MQEKYSTTKIKSYLKFNWFKVVLLTMLVFVIMRKDFSFNFNLNTPTEIETVKSNKKAPKKKTAKKKKETITERKEPAAVAKGSTSFLDIIPFFRSNKKKDYSSALSNVDEDVKKAYIKRFAHVAINERQKYGIPASIILANSLLHSQAGRLEITRKGNNHFLIKCSPGWIGDTANFKGDCYRQYESAWTSFRDHSKYITTGKFEHLRKLDSTDYKAWAKALEKADYSNQKRFAKQLISIINQYELYQFDED